MKFPGMAFGVVVALVLAERAAATVITTNGMDAFSFQNPDRVSTAIDFHVTLLSAPPPLIGGGSGGPEFPGGKLPDLTGTTIMYDIGARPRGPGVGPQGTYYHEFPNWPKGTQFDIKFSFGSLAYVDAVVVARGVIPARLLPTDVGFTVPTPEPSTGALVGAVLLIIGCFCWLSPTQRRRTRRNPCKSLLRPHPAGR